MNEEDLAFEFIDALHQEDFQPCADTFKNAGTFDQVGVLTLDKGFVVRLLDGSEFQITIKRSKYS